MFRFISFLIFTLFLFSCKQKTELLQAELKSFMMKVDFKLYSDSTYTMERIYEIDSAKNETLTGKFQLIKDTIICSGDFNFKGYLKNQFY